MAKKEEKSKIVLERVYNVPLRREFQKVPKYKRAKKAVTALRYFLKRHMKADSIKIGKHLNEKIWVRGIKNPPHHVKISVVKDDKGVVKAELVGKPIFEEEPKEDKKKAKATDVTKEEKKEHKEEKEPKEEKKEHKETKEPKEEKKEHKEAKEPEEEKKEHKEAKEPKEEKKEHKEAKEPKEEKKKHKEAEETKKEKKEHKEKTEKKPEAGDKKKSEKDKKA